MQSEEPIFVSVRVLYFFLIFAFHLCFTHSPLQITLVLFLQCIKLMSCYVSVLCVGSGIKALGQFYFICICCQNNVFILKRLFSNHLSGGLVEAACKKKKLISLKKRKKEKACCFFYVLSCEY